MPSYDVSPNGKLIGAPPEKQKAFNEFIGQNHQDAAKLGLTGSDDKKRPR